MGMPTGISRSRISNSRISSSSIKNNKIKKGNPDPTNCKIIDIQTWRDSKIILLVVKYPDCTNFEGMKILVFENTTWEELSKQKKSVGIDPHFSDSKKYFHPIARFEPSEKGLYNAMRFCENVLAEKFYK